MGTSKSGTVRTVLVAVVGGSPAIVTETLWALAHERGECIDEVRLITTSKGRDAVLRSLLNPESRRFEECCCECGLDPREIKFDISNVEVLRDADGSELGDIRNSRQNELAADQICALIRQWTSDKRVRLHCSVAGGRKTMSIYLTIAMMLYGRAEDRLWHVLVEPEEFERCADFFHPYKEPRMLTTLDRAGQPLRQLSTGDVRIDLADIPFVSLRELDTAEALRPQQSYLGIVSETQGRLQFLANAVSVRIEKPVRPYWQVPLVVAGRNCKLPPASGVLYALLAARQKVSVAGAGLSVDELTPEELKQTYGFLTGQSYNPALEGTVFDFIVQWIKLIEGRRGATAEKVAEANFSSLKSAVEQAVNRANLALRRAQFPHQFAIVNLSRDKRHQPARYTLQLPPEAIQLPD